MKNRPRKQHGRTRKLSVSKRVWPTPSSCNNTPPLISVDSPVDIAPVVDRPNPMIAANDDKDNTSLATSLPRMPPPLTPRQSTHIWPSSSRGTAAPGPDPPDHPAHAVDPTKVAATTPPSLLHPIANPTSHEPDATSHCTTIRPPFTPPLQPITRSAPPAETMPPCPMDSTPTTYVHQASPARLCQPDPRG